MLDEQRALFMLEPKVVVLEPQWIKSTERAKRPLIPPVYPLRGISAYDELQIVVADVGQGKQTVTAEKIWRPWVIEAVRVSETETNTSRLMVTAPTEDAAPRKPLAETHKQVAVFRPHRGEEADKTTNRPQQGHDTS